MAPKVLYEYCMYSKIGEFSLPKNPLILLHSKWPKLCEVLAVLSAIQLLTDVLFIEFHKPGIQQCNETVISSKKIPNVTLVIIQKWYKTIMEWYQFLAFGLLYESLQVLNG